MSNTEKPKQTIRQTISSVKYMVSRIVHKRHGKSYILFKGIEAILNAAFPLVLTVFPGLIINELVSERRNSVLILEVGVLLLSPVFERFIHILLDRKLIKLSLSLRNDIETEYYIHLSQVDFEYREQPDIEMMGGRAGDTLRNSIYIISQIFSFISSAISLIAVFSIVSMINPLIILLIIAMILINSVVTKHTNLKIYSLNIESDKVSRFLLMFTTPLEQYLYAKDMKMFGLTSLMLNKKMEAETEDSKINLKRNAHQSLANICYAFTGLIQQLALYAYLIYNVIEKNLAVGTMSIYLTASGQFSGALSNMFNSYLNLANNTQSVQELKHYVSLPLKQKLSGHKKPIFNSNSIIEFQNASFKYPGSEQYAIKDLNLIIFGNEKLCIVGENGSGKTTFIKLLTRLYSLTEGKMLLNGVDVNEYDLGEYQRLFVPVFQNYQLMDGLTIGENIISASTYDRVKLDKICNDGRLSQLINKLPKGYDTHISKWLDEEGINLSGGEEQRVAIARACYHGGDVFLLDEPTAALDPLAEYEIYTQFNNMITDKCAVLITHRLSAVQLADKVAVFNSGNVVEYGTHKELYAKGGLYTEMFDKQAKFYRDKP